MLFVNHTSNASAAERYFDSQLSPSDYYLRDAQELGGVWYGLGAERMGLPAMVGREEYFRLCNNLHPITGEQLTPRTRIDRRVLYDFTFDLGKSVSLAFELGGDERILDAFRGAVEATVSDMERDVMTRVRTDGSDTDRTTSNLVAALFVHRTTRPVADPSDPNKFHPDPQLHCHATIFNCTFDSHEQRWKAAQLSSLVSQKGYHQAAFHSRLAERLASLGYGIERDGNSFRLAGIDRETCEVFSRRTAIIEAEAERLGITDPKAKGELGRRTRNAKDAQGATISELREEWKARISEAQLDSIVNARSGQKTTTLNALQAMDYAIDHCYERASVVPEKELLKHALIESVGRASVQDVHGELLRPDFIRRDIEGQRYTTTKGVHEEERSMVAFVKEGRGRHRPLAGKRTALDQSLSQEQRNAALTLLTSRDRVAGLLRGNAGSGKTRMMREVVKAIEAGGKKVYPFAPSAEASRGVLRAEGFAEAETVEKLLTDTELQEKVKGQVLWIDEAGLCPVRDMNRIFELAERQDCRVLLSGDTKQHFGVLRGDALRLIESKSGMKIAELREVRRQTNEAYREAVAAISEGDTVTKDGKTRFQEGVELLDRMGAVVEVEGEDRHRHIAADYVKTTSEFNRGKPTTALVVSPTHAEADRVTECIREELKAANRLGQEERELTSLRLANFTEAQRGIAPNYAPGHVIQFHRNLKGFKRGERVQVTDAGPESVSVRRADGTPDLLPLHEAGKFQVYETGCLKVSAGDKIRITQNGFTRETKRGLRRVKDRLNNGSIYEVAGFSRDGDLRLTNGYIVPKTYGTFSLGYAITSHAAQGKTYDVALIATGVESLGATNREQFYVSATRARDQVRFYTDDKAAMFSAIRSSAARLSATEMLEGMSSKPKRSFGLRQMFSMQRVQQTYAALRSKIPMMPRPQPRREGPRHGR